MFNSIFLASFPTFRQSSGEACTLVVDYWAVYLNCLYFSFSVLFFIDLTVVLSAFKSTIYVDICAVMLAFIIYKSTDSLDLIFFHSLRTFVLTGAF